MSANTVSLFEAIKQRCSLHTLTSDVSISDARIQEIVREAILRAPTPFNCQSGRAVVLLNDEHKKFWDIAHDAAKASVPPQAFEKAFEPRVKMFRAAYGTVYHTKKPTRLGDFADLSTCVLRFCSTRARMRSTRLGGKCPW